MNNKKSSIDSTKKTQFFLSKTLFLVAAFLSFLFSVFLYFLVDRMQGIFVGIWVPSILSAGSLYLMPRPKGE